MTKDQYLRMVEQTGEEIDWDRCPPEAEDFPHSVTRAVNIFNTLGDRVYGDVGYTGKDYTSLPLLFKIYKIQDALEKDWCMELLIHLDRKQLVSSQKKLKQELDRVRKK